MSDNKILRQKMRDARRRRTRIRVRKSKTRPRMAVFRTARHMYAQIIDDNTGNTVASSSTLIKEFKDAEFTAADGDFIIRNQRILTDNTKIYSKTIDLRAQGWVDFDQNINFDIVPDFGEAGIIKADNILQFSHFLQIINSIIAVFF